MTSTCPKCGSQKIDIETDVEVRGLFAFKDFVCLDCKTAGCDTFKLVYLSTDIDD